MHWMESKYFKVDVLPGVAIEVVAGTDYTEPHCEAAAAAVRDFVEGAHEATGLAEGPDLYVDQD